jgi:hypothetical protein
VTTYRRGQAAQNAQYTLDLHVFSETGMCVYCREPWPCVWREDAMAILAATFMLPRRRVGNSRPDIRSTVSAPMAGLLLGGGR